MGDDTVARFQRAILAEVSRTFALTIPQLPPSLADVVGNAYLLCRIADTVEDDTALTIDDKRRLHALFTRVVQGAGPAEAFAREAAARLGSASTAERNLVANAPLVMEMTRRFSVRQQAALARCVGEMCAGMPRFERAASLAGLADLDELREYCRVVAGVVGEMLTELFCEHAPQMARRRGAMMRLGVSFGRGLQITNILKDFWEDHDRGVCWLPRDVFIRSGIELRDIRRERLPERFHHVYCELVGVAHAELRAAMAYTLLVPAAETGIRRFCLIAIGLAMRTLRCIVDSPGFTSGSEVKVSRQVVAATLLAARLYAADDRALRRWFARLADGLPAPADEPLQRVPCRTCAPAGAAPVLRALRE